MKFDLILLTLCLCIDLIFAAYGENGPYWDGPVQACGQKLGAELSIICKGRYNEDPRKYYSL